MSDSAWCDSDSSALCVYRFNTWNVVAVYSLIIVALSAAAILLRGFTTHRVVILMIQLALLGGATAAARNRAVTLDKHFLLYTPAYGTSVWIWWYQVQKAQAAKVPFMNGSVPGLKFAMNTGSEIGVPLDLEQRPEVMEYVKEKLGNRACF